jgi:hypothetical protein
MHFIYKWRKKTENAYNVGRHIAYIVLAMKTDRSIYQDRLWTNIENKSELRRRRKKHRGRRFLNCSFLQGALLFRSQASGYADLL